MGKTTNSTGKGATAEYKVKKLTLRRITMMKEFLTKTIDSPDNIGEFVGSVAWMDMLIEFLREPKRCRSTKMDILAWLKDDCFKLLIGQVVCSAAKRTDHWSGTMEQSINQVKLVPMSSDEDANKQTFLPLRAIKRKIETVEEEVENQQGFEHAGQTVTGNQNHEAIWGLSAIKEESEMVTVKEDLMLDDEFAEKLVSIKSENQDPMDENLMAEIDNDHCLDLSLNRSAVAFCDEMLETEQTNHVMEPENPLGDSLTGCNVRVSSEEIPILTSYTQRNNFPPEPTKPQSDELTNQLPCRVTFTRKDSTDFAKKMSDAVMNMVQDRQRRNDLSKDWNTIFQALTIVQTALKDID